MAMLEAANPNPCHNYGAWFVAVAAPGMAVPVYMALRKAKSDKIYSLWLAVAVSAVLYGAFLFVLVKLKWLAAGVFTLPDGFAWLMRAQLILLDLNHELDLLAFLVALVVVPQALAYIASGISGDARSPFLVRHTFDGARWLIVKALCTVGGMFLVMITYLVWVGYIKSVCQAVQSYLLGVAIIGLAFMLGGVGEWFEDLFNRPDTKTREWLVERLRRTHERFTRNAPKQRSDD